MDNSNDNPIDSHACKSCGTPPENIRRRSATIRKIASMFEDAPPAHVHDDGSQTYGPYTNSTKED